MKTSVYIDPLFFFHHLALNKTHEITFVTSEYVILQNKVRFFLFD